MDSRNPPNEYLQEQSVLALERLGDLLESLIDLHLGLEDIQTATMVPKIFGQEGAVLKVRRDE